jgi:hypothetical protein
LRVLIFSFSFFSTCILRTTWRLMVTVNGKSVGFVTNLSLAHFLAPFCLSSILILRPLLYTMYAILTDSCLLSAGCHREVSIHSLQYVRIRTSAYFFFLHIYIIVTWPLICRQEFFRVFWPRCLASLFASLGTV